MKEVMWRYIGNVVKTSKPIIQIISPNNGKNWKRNFKRIKFLSFPFLTIFRPFNNTYLQCYQEYNLKGDEKVIKM